MAQDTTNVDTTKPRRLNDGVSIPPFTSAVIAECIHWGPAFVKTDEPFTAGPTVDWRKV